MIELVLLVCLASNPTECHKEWPPFESSQATMHACMFEGQRQAVQWAEAHPKYRVRKWSCGLVGVVNPPSFASLLIARRIR